MKAKSSSKSLFKFDAKSAAKQYFSLPYYITCYIKNNSLSTITPENYCNLTKTCKYFYTGFYPMFLNNVMFQDGYWCIYENEVWKKSDKLELISTNLWLTDYLNICLDSPINTISNIFKNVIRCDVRELRICHQKMTFNEVKFLTSSKKLKIFNLNETVVVKNNNDSKIVLLETIFENLLHVEDFIYWLNENMLSMISSQTIESIGEKMRASKLKYFFLSGIDSSFNFNDFQVYMKKHPEIHFVLHFHGQFSEEEIKKFQTFVDKILESPRPLHQPTVISFPGQNGVKFGDLVKLSWSYL